MLSLVTVVAIVLLLLESISVLDKLHVIVSCVSKVLLKNT